MKYVIIFSILLSFTGCFNSVSTPNDSDSNSNIQSSTEDFNWINSRTRVRVFKFLSHNESEMYFHRERTDDHCKITFENDVTKREWGSGEIDTVWYRIENDTLKTSIDGVFNYPSKYVGSSKLEGIWNQVFPDNFDISLNIQSDNMTEEIEDLYPCAADSYIFEGSAAQKISCETVFIENNADTLYFTEGITEEVAVNIFKLDNENCLISSNLRNTAQSCVDTSSSNPYLSDDCSSVLVNIPKLFNGNSKFCTEVEYNDSYCDEGCLNYDQDPGCLK